MRIVITSDLHYQQQHPHTDSVIRDFVRELADLKPDCLIIGGDIGEGVSNAYFGNVTLGNRILASSKVHHVIQRTYARRCGRDDTRCCTTSGDANYRC